MENLNAPKAKKIKLTDPLDLLRMRREASRSAYISLGELINLQVSVMNIVIQAMHIKPANDMPHQIHALSMRYEAIYKTWDLCADIFKETSDALEQALQEAADNKNSEKNANIDS
jgi:hypothetical protein